MKDGEVGTEWEQAAPEITDLDCSEAFTAFDQEEAARLQLYVEQVDGMLGSPFLKQSRSLNVKGQTDPAGMRTEVAYVGEDLLRAFMSYFRPLYLHEAGGFKHTRAVLRRHAVEKRTPDAKEVLVALDGYGRTENEARKHSVPFAMREVTPDGREVDLRAERIMDDYIYGKYAKLDPDKAARLRAHPHPEIYHFVFMSTVTNLVGVYADLSTVARMILKEPELLLP
jgi:hypothetical protein